LINFQTYSFAQSPDKRIIYVSSLYGEPDGELGNIQLFNSVFGSGTWEHHYYESLEMSDLLNDSVCLIYLEGSYLIQEHFIDLWNLYHSELEDYVSLGGNMIINFNVNLDSNYYIGFDSVMRYAGGVGFAEGQLNMVSNPIYFGPNYNIDTIMRGCSLLGYPLGGGDFFSTNFDTLLISTNDLYSSALIKQFDAGNICITSFYVPDTTLYTNSFKSFRKNLLWHLAPCLHSEKDLGIHDIIYPKDDCNISEFTLQALVHNFGFADQDNYEISYQLDSGAIINASFSQNIIAYLSDTVSFSLPAVIHDCGVHSIKIWTTLSGDTIAANDTLFYTFKNICAEYSTTGLPDYVCNTDTIITANPEAGGGFWSGVGITDSIAGTFNPALIENGNYTVINYDFASPIAYTLETIPFEQPEFTDVTNISLLYDDDVDTLAIPFYFHFFNNTYDTIYPCSNGYISLGEPHDTWAVSIPGETINNLICVACSDLQPGSGSVYYSIEGVAPYRRFLMRWEDVQFWFFAGKKIDATVVLHETTSVIDFYIDHLPPVDELGILMGISNEDGSLYYEPRNTWWDGANDTAFRFNPVLCPAIIQDTVFVGPQVLVTITNATDGAANGSAIAEAFYGIPPYTFLWNTGDTSQTINDLFAGEYSVTVTDAEGCTTIKTIIIENSVGIFSTPQSSIIIYPNPASDILYISTENISGNIAIQLFNMTGERIIEKTFATSPLIQLNISELPTGIYLVKAISGNSEISKMLVVE
ncbi:MAG TPA: T9SS type A sorting domain-containing protein, partial [Chitinophagales bacterium]|nr:T9SS type A sorting domain-containing protein [Chitinophagales bacterium]